MINFFCGFDSLSSDHKKEDIRKTHSFVHNSNQERCLTFQEVHLDASTRTKTLCATALHVAPPSVSEWLTRGNKGVATRRPPMLTSTTIPTLPPYRMVHLQAQNCVSTAWATGDSPCPPRDSDLMKLPLEKQQDWVALRQTKWSTIGTRVAATRHRERSTDAGSFLPCLKAPKWAVSCARTSWWSRGICDCRITNVVVFKKYIFRTIKKDY